MNGAQALIASLTGAGVDVCFMNPGTSEMHFVAALDSVPQMRGVLALFEGVATGAADGYARIAGRPAAVLLHLGPGLANGLANLHNARRAGSPVLTIVGAHATGHVRYDAPLQSDIEALARTVSGWVHTSGTTRDLAQDAMRALAAARRGQIATLVLPADVSWSEGGTLAPPRHPAQPTATDPAQHRPSTMVDDGQVTVSGRPAVFPGVALPRRESPVRARPAGGQPDQRRDRSTAARRDVPGPDGARRRAAGRRPAGLPRRTSRSPAGRGRAPHPGRRALAGVVLRLPRPAQRPGARDACSVAVLADRDQDAEAALEQLADLVAAGTPPVLAAPAVRPAEPGPLTAISLANTIAASLPEGAIISDEANTSGFALPAALTGAARHSLLTLTGGSIGQGLPAATGAAVAAPDRPVLCLEADGSALYTIQALWTQAREQLNVTTVLINNAAYAILRMELARTAAGQAGERAARMLDLSGPTPDFTAISTGFGVPAVRVTTAEDLDRELRRSYAEPGPHLIEAIVPPVIPAPGTAW